MRDSPCARIEHCRSGNCETDWKLLFCVSARPSASSGGFDGDLNRAAPGAAQCRERTPVQQPHWDRLRSGARGMNRGRFAKFRRDQRPGKLRPHEFSSHTIRAAGPRQGLYRAHNCRPGWCSPAGSRSTFASHRRIRMLAAEDNTEHLQLRWQRRVWRHQGARQHNLSLLSYASKGPSPMGCLLTL
jgi:hypothetical protein